MCVLRQTSCTYFIKLNSSRLNSNISLDPSGAEENQGGGVGLLVTYGNLKEALHIGDGGEVKPFSPFNIYILLYIMTTP